MGCEGRRLLGSATPCSVTVEYSVLYDGSGGYDASLELASSQQVRSSLLLWP